MTRNMTSKSLFVLVEDESPSKVRSSSLFVIYTLVY